MNEKKLIIKLKYNAFRLKEGGMIPPLLFTEICSLDHNSSEDDVRFLMFVTENLMRVKGYYLRYHFDSDVIEKQIEDLKKVWKGKSK